MRGLVYRYGLILHGKRPHFTKMEENTALAASRVWQSCIMRGWFEGTCFEALAKLPFK